MGTHNELMRTAYVYQANCTITTIEGGTCNE